MYILSRYATAFKTLYAPTNSFPAVKVELISEQLRRSRRPPGHVSGFFFGVRENLVALEKHLASVPNLLFQFII
jgi:hypothetical protein